MARRVLLAVAAAMAAGAARADPVESMGAGAPALDATANRIVSEALYDRAGAPVVVFHYFAVGADCGPRPVSITVTAPPAHGRFALSEGKEPAVSGGAPLWTGADPRAHCLDRLVDTRDGAYSPDPGFSGKDQLAVTFKEGDAVFTDAIEVNVVTINAPPPARGTKPPRVRTYRTDAATSGAGGR